MLLKTKHKPHANVKMNLPIVGEVQIKDGIVDVSKEVHDLLIGDGKNEWTTGEPTVDTQLNVDEIQKMVDSLTFEEVFALAKEAKIKNYQVFAKNEKALRTFVIKKLRESQENAINEELLKQLEIDGAEDTGNPLDQENI